VQQDIQQHYDASHPGQVQVIGADLWNGSPAQVQSFRNQTGALFPLLLQGAAATGGNLETLYGTYDNYVVMNKQGIVRYHAALLWPHGNRYHLDQIRGCVDSLVAGTVDAPPAAPASLALAVGPSPFRDATGIALAVPAPGRARVAVHDVSGRRVATLHDGPVAAGWTRLAWNGRDDGGRRSPAGVYLVAAEVDGRRLVRRAVLLP
jgi:hypothetical protein